ncbi:MAG: hypothetical protein Q7U78_13745 [Gallionella sp.]|nr:hypothetical protein [Gallionella sp.]
MKTVLFINSSGARYFRRVNRIWQLIAQPERKDKLWVIANLPEETLEVFTLPLLFGRDRSNFLERHLVSAFPRSSYRAAPLISGNLFKPGTAVLTGLTTAETVTSKLDKLDIPIAGVWGMSMLLTLMAGRLAIRDVILVMPSVHYLRILVIKEGAPVLTRCIHRYHEDNNAENDSDTNEILRTRQHLENHRIFEHDAAPPVLYLGDASVVTDHLTRAGLTLLPVPNAFLPDGEAGYLHPLFEYVISSPRGQLAPLQLRARHLAENIRLTAHLGIAASLLSIVLFGQDDFRALIALHGKDNSLRADLQLAESESQRLEDHISTSGLDPALVRQATRFAALEMEAAPAPEAIFQFTAAAIADLPQVRIKSLTFRFPKAGERYCQGHSVIELPLIDHKIDLPLGGSQPRDADNNDATGVPARHTELQFTILQNETLAPTAQIELLKRISATLKAKDGVQLMEDPAAFSLINTLKGGFGMDAQKTDNLWCMSVAWKTTPAGGQP